MGNRSMFVGLDVHKETIDVSIAEGERDGEVIVPCAVIACGGVVGIMVALLTVRAGAVLARPKSSSLAIGGAEAPLLRARKILPGFRSRWTIPCRWAAASASAIWIAIRSASSSGRPDPLALARAHRVSSVSPSRSSMTRNAVPACSPP